MSRLDFSVADLNLPATRDKTRRASISGVQDKVQLKRVRGKFVVVDSGGDYILKPVPRNTFAELAADIPANESLTMDIASKVLFPFFFGLLAEGAQKDRQCRELRIDENDHFTRLLETSAYGAIGAVYVKA